MILYLDTSALVKAYVSEEASAAVMAAIASAQAVASHLIAFVEAHAAFARLYRQGTIEEAAFLAIKREFTADWSDYLRVGLTQSLVQRAADLAEAFALRAYDSVHLAAADFLFNQKVAPMTFAGFDRRLNQAASVLGIPLLQTDRAS